MANSGLSKLATLTASTKRPPVLVGGMRGVASTYLSGLKCTPIDPLPAQEGDILRRAGLNTPHELKTTFLIGNPDIRIGDILVVAGVDYPIRKLNLYSGASSGADSFTWLIVEDLQT